MPAGRSAHHADLVRIDAQTRGVGPQISNRGLDVVNGGWKRRRRSQSIIGSGADIASLGERHAGRMIALPRPGAKTSAMDSKNRGTNAGFLGPDNIHRLLRIGLRIGDSCFRKEIGGNGLRIRRAGEQYKESGFHHSTIDHSW